MSTRTHTRLLLLPCIFTVLLSLLLSVHAQLFTLVAITLICLSALLLRQKYCLRLLQAFFFISSFFWLANLNDAAQMGPELFLVLLLLPMQILSALLLQHHRLRHYFGFPRAYLFR